MPEPKYYYEASDFWLEFRKDIYNEEYLQSLNLNNRQIKAVLFVKENGKITNSEYQEINSIGKTTATEDLSELVKLKLLKPSGVKGRGAKYELK